MRGVRASEIIVVKSESGQYISTGLTSSLGLFSLIYWPLSLFTPLRSLLWKVISEALTRGHKFILFSHHQYNQYKALLCSCSPISISAFMAFLGYFWFWIFFSFKSLIQISSSSSSCTIYRWEQLTISFSTAHFLHFLADSTRSFNQSLSRSDDCKAQWLQQYFRDIFRPLRLQDRGV